MRFSQKPPPDACSKACRDKEPKGANMGKKQTEVLAESGLLEPRDFALTMNALTMIGAVAVEMDF